MRISGQSLIADPGVVSQLGAATGYDACAAGATARVDGPPGLTRTGLTDQWMGGSIGRVAFGATEA